MQPIEACASLPTLADTLWAERGVVEHLLYRLVAARLLLAADERRHVPRALQEVENALDGLWETERDRKAAVRMVADDWGIPAEELTLKRMAEEAPEPWATILDEHHESFARITAEVEHTARENSRLAAVGLNAVQSSLQHLTGPAVGTYSATGRAETTAPGATTINRFI